MVDSTATSGNILKGGELFLHNIGTGNTFLGSNAGNLTLTGSYNTACGFQALRNDGTGYNNAASGAFALYYNTGGHSNTASGTSALQNNTSGFSNTAIGDGALYANTTGGANTASGFEALLSNATSFNNTASGYQALYSNTIGNNNTASGAGALYSNTTGSGNTAFGFNANVSSGSFTNATAIGNGAIATASNMVRVGNSAVTVIQGQVGFTASSDVRQKENFQPVDGEEVLGKLRRLPLSSWNFIGHDSRQFRHYGPMAQDFFAAFGRDAVGTIGTDTTITSTDMDGILMIAAQALEKRSVRQQEEIAVLKAENAELKTHLKALERKIK